VHIGRQQTITHAMPCEIADRGERRWHGPARFPWLGGGASFSREPIRLIPGWGIDSTERSGKTSILRSWISNESKSGLSIL